MFGPKDYEDIEMTSCVTEKKVSITEYIFISTAMDKLRKITKKAKVQCVNCKAGRIT